MTSKAAHTAREGGEPTGQGEGNDFGNFEGGAHELGRWGRRLGKGWRRGAMGEGDDWVEGDEATLVTSMAAHTPPG